MYSSVARAHVPLIIVRVRKIVKATSPNRFSVVERAPCSALGGPVVSTTQLGLESNQTLMLVLPTTSVIRKLTPAHELAR